MHILQLLFICYCFTSFSQFTHEDSLRGSITPERAWWDVQFHRLEVEISPSTRAIKGKNTIHFKTLASNNILQIDLQSPLKIDSVYHGSLPVATKSITKNVWHILLPTSLQKAIDDSITVYYSGHPITAKNAPWDGGIVWTKDSNGKDFIASACQGIGASAWWPCKDHGYDEPDLGMQISITTPEKLMSISNGRLVGNKISNNKRTTTWKVVNPINNYGVNFNVGDYVDWGKRYKNRIDMRFFVLPEHYTSAKRQFKDAYRMMKAFEHWFGPYPFPEDGYKIIEVPYLGMEHQSSVTYGNGFKNGYLGRDLSGTGWGLKWDFIIIHESGHEWFANNITCKDNADLWIHESFTSYSEALFTEYYYGKKAGAEYVQGIRKNILNETPMIGPYGVNAPSSTDIYYKGSNMLHTLRQIVANDKKWLAFLRDINHDFRHQTVTTQQIEAYIASYFQLDLTSFFQQYLRTTKLPKLAVIEEGEQLLYRWENCVDGFNMPIDVVLDNKKKVRLYPTQEYKIIQAKKIIIDNNYYL